MQGRRRYPNMKSRLPFLSQTHHRIMHKMTLMSLVWSWNSLELI